MFNAAANAVNIDDVARAIQLALAPVFLLTGIAGLLNVMAGRLSRIIDRGRRLTENPTPHEQEHWKIVEVELQDLDHRRHLTSAAITACTLSALGICTVIAALFLEVLLQVELKWIVGLAFTASTLALVVSLAYFLREVHLATKTVRIPVTVRKKGSDKNE
jgi:1-aminocyclopropane-1-carboxylate deaminase/D-cysteine desulfhydrase-like pyridoxal-dependent ACC family enzyme